MVIVTSTTPRLDLHGEVSSMVESLVNGFIKDNYLMKKKVVCIIHGKSTNILTKEVNKTLSKNKMVNKYYLNGWNLGETVVILNEHDD
jgi:dsDNA-specific endonuclease/ATPase MutS2